MEEKSKAKEHIYFNKYNKRKEPKKEVKPKKKPQKTSKIMIL